MQGKAHIIGGGIAGAAAAKGLLAAGWSVEVHERAGGLPANGTALGMWPEAMRSLDSIGAGDRVRDQSIHQSGAAILDPTGRAIARVGGKQEAYLIARPALLAALHDGIPTDAVTWNSPAASIESLPDVDVIIGADGINSVIRRSAFPGHAAPRPLGTVALRGVVAGRVDGVTETWGPGRLFGITPHGPDTTNWFACLRIELLEGMEGRRDVDILRDNFGDWHPAVVNVLDSLDGAAIDRRTLFDVAPLPSYVSGNRVLVGDAAHAMAPNLGRGACEALLDAVTLAEALIAEPSIGLGLRRYDAARRRASQRTLRASRLLNRLSTTRHLLGTRNAFLAGASRLA